MHVDTGHNFAEVIDYRDGSSPSTGVRLVVASVQESIDAGRVVEDTGPRASRNRLQSVTLLDAIAEHGFDAAFGGGRRDEDKARAKERILSFRDRQGRWDPRQQRPEPWDVLNARIRKGEHLRAFPLSNWTELDIWQLHRRARRAAAEHLLQPHAAPSSSATACCCPSAARSSSSRARCRSRQSCATAPSATRAAPARCESDRRHRRRRHRRGRRRTDHRARRHPCRRHVQRICDGRPQARGILLMSTADTRRVAQRGTLRIATAGSVDDGKSTLIGRLLHDTKTVFEDQLSAVVKASRRYGDGETNLALLTDGLRAEREQGITIDVAHRYFATPHRSFIVADTPGHAQYTRNMVTGASTADVAIVLVDARHGVVEQTRRHCVHRHAARRARPSSSPSTRWTSSIGTKPSSTASPRRSTSTSGALPTPVPVIAVPLSALLGDNVVELGRQHAVVRRPPLLRAARGVRRRSAGSRSAPGCTCSA